MDVGYAAPESVHYAFQTLAYTMSTCATNRHGKAICVADNIGEVEQSLPAVSEVVIFMEYI
jgi:hypothetical protein